MFSLDYMKVSGQLREPAALPPGKCPLDRRLGAPESQSGRTPVGNRTSSPGRPARSCFTAYSVLHVETFLRTKVMSSVQSMRRVQEPVKQFQSRSDILIRGSGSMQMYSTHSAAGRQDFTRH
jgi:hypothetical protein